MKIRLGLHLDAQRGWHAKNSLGEITVGTNGMLNILESQLGLISGSIPQSQRVVQYLDCLKQSDSESRFYHSSLQTDELGTAATLLNWRDQWYLNGWNGKVETGNSRRLDDIADVERIAIGKVAPSQGERLGMILQEMAKRNSCAALKRATYIAPKINIKTAKKNCSINYIFKFSHYFFEVKKY